MTRWRGSLASTLLWAIQACSASPAPSGGAVEDAARAGEEQSGALPDDAGSPEASPEGASAYTIRALDEARIGSENSTGWSYIDRALADVDWKEGPFGRVLLIVDLSSACYPFTKWANDPPPVGQNWPADCDAFDRNFDVFIDDSGASSPPYEIVHAITPFGGPEHIEADITDLANALPGHHRMRFELVSFSDPQGQITGSNGGWTVSARVEVTPGPSPRRIVAVRSLFAGQMSAGDTPPQIAFDVPAGATSGRIEYRTSGHGQGPQALGCVGPAEEFCARQHQILIDGTTAKTVQPYRQDCQTLCTWTHYGSADAGFDYCQENPCGAPSSVTAPRANWCPGSMTAPFVWDDIPALATPGAHTFSFQISPIANGGSWLVSAIYYAYGDG